MAAHECNRSFRPTDKHRLDSTEFRSTSGFDRRNLDTISGRPLASGQIASHRALLSTKATRLSDKSSNHRNPARWDPWSDPHRFDRPGRTPPPRAETLGNSL